MSADELKVGLGLSKRPINALLSSREVSRLL